MERRRRHSVVALSAVAVVGWGEWLWCSGTSRSPASAGLILTATKRRSCRAPHSSRPTTRTSRRDATAGGKSDATVPCPTLSGSNRLRIVAGEPSSPNQACTFDPASPSDASARAVWFAAGVCSLALAQARGRRRSAEVPSSTAQPNLAFEVRPNGNAPSPPPGFAYHPAGGLGTLPSLPSPLNVWRRISTLYGR